MSLSFEVREESLKQVSCSSPIWLLSSLFEFITIVIFYRFVKTVEDSTLEYISKEKNWYGYRDEHFHDQYKRINNLWLIMKVYSVMSFYLLCFTIISFLWAQHIQDCDQSEHTLHHKYLKCNVITMIPVIDTWLWFLSRMFAYFIW